MFLDLMDRSLHEIFSELGTDGLAQGWRIHLANHAESSRGGNQVQVFCLAFCDRDVQLARERGQKRALRPSDTSVLEDVTMPSASTT